MAKKRDAHNYELELRRMIKERTGAPCELWLYPQVRAAASNMVMLDKVEQELLDAKELTNTVDGSTGQKKKEVNPLMPYYLKLQAELRLQYEALGLNYRTTPSKVIEDTKKGVDDSDPMRSYYEGK